MNKMKSILSGVFLFLSLAAMSQPSAVKKAQDAVFTLSTFKTDGSLITTTTGVFIDNKGTAVSTWKPFIDAARAVAIDANGMEHQVEVLLGANEIYDMAKFRVGGTIRAFASPASPSATSSAYLLPYKKNGTAQQVSISSTEKFMDKYNYYVVSATQSDRLMGSPAVNSNGQLLGIYSQTTSTASITDASFARDFVLSGLSANDPALQRSHIRVGLPSHQDQALVAMMMSQQKGDAVYEAAINDFIAQFPTANDGYFSKATLRLAQNNAADADKVMKDAISKTTNKAEAHFNYARVIQQYLIYADPSKSSAPASWSFDEAIRETQTAYDLSHQPQYLTLKADLTYSKKEYQLAYDMYAELIKTQPKSPDLHYKQMQCRQQLGADDNELLSLLNKTIAVCDTPYTVAAAPYLLARGIQKDKMGQPREAIRDMVAYEVAMQGQCNAEFYYLREQTEKKAKAFQPALNDISHACILDPANPLYWAELASLELRFKKYKEAAIAAERCVKLNEQAADAYLILGISQCETGSKAEGIQNIEKAQQLGNEQATQFLKKYKG